MGELKKYMVGLLILSLIAISFPGAPLCTAASLFAQADLDTITRHEPKIMSTPQEDIPLMQTEKSEEKGTSKWLLIGLGVLAIGGLAMAAGGGGGGGDPEPDPTGSVSVGW